MLLADGKVTTHGVKPPEGCIDPNDFLAVAMPVMMARAGGKAEARGVDRVRDHPGRQLGLEDGALTARATVTARLV
ncbi:MAG: hypothetical protein U0610_31055 [bacterium]